jgi:hypothetical protein
MGTPASSGLSVSPARPAAPVQPKAPVVIDQSDMYTNVFSRFADRHTKDGDMFGMFIPCCSFFQRSFQGMNVGS